MFGLLALITADAARRRGIVDPHKDVVHVDEAPAMEAEVAPQPVEEEEESDYDSDDDWGVVGEGPGAGFLKRAEKRKAAERKQRAVDKDFPKPETSDGAGAARRKNGDRVDAAAG